MDLGLLSFLPRFSLSPLRSLFLRVLRLNDNIIFMNPNTLLTTSPSIQCWSRDRGTNFLPFPCPTHFPLPGQTTTTVEPSNLYWGALLLRGKGIGYREGFARKWCGVGGMQDVVCWRVCGWVLAMKFSVRFGWNLNFNSIWLIINYLRVDVWDSYGTVGFANKLSLLHHRKQSS